MLRRARTTSTLGTQTQSSSGSSSSRGPGHRRYVNYCCKQNQALKGEASKQCLIVIWPEFSSLLCLQAMTSTLQSAHHLAVQCVTKWIYSQTTYKHSEIFNGTQQQRSDPPPSTCASVSANRVDMCGQSPAGWCPPPLLNTQHALTVCISQEQSALQLKHQKMVICRLSRSSGGILTVKNCQLTAKFIRTSTDSPVQSVSGTGSAAIVCTQSYDSLTCLPLAVFSYHCSSV